MRNVLRFSTVLSILALFSFTAPSAEAVLLIGSTRGNSITVFDESTNTFLGDFTDPGVNGLRDPDTLIFGPDGNLYVSVGGNSGANLFDPTYPQDSAVLKYSPTGDFLGVFASSPLLKRPYGIAFGPDNKLYVSSFRTNQILRFDGTTGSFLDVFASDNNGGLGTTDGLNGPNGLLFGPDGSLYVTTQGSVNTPAGDLDFPTTLKSQVLRYSPEQVLGLAPTTTPTVFIDQPTPLPETFNFVSFLGLTLSPDAESLYVSDFAGGIRRYDLTGQVLEVFSTNYTGTTPSNNFIGALTFGFDSDDLYTVGFDFTNNNLGSILKFENGVGSETSFVGEVFTSNSLVRPVGIVAAVPEPTTIAGLAIAAAGLGMVRQRQRKA